jgi:hypothetical protein
MPPPPVPAVLSAIIELLTVISPRSWAIAPPLRVEELFRNVLSVTVARPTLCRPAPMKAVLPVYGAGGHGQRPIIRNIVAVIRNNALIERHGSIVCDRTIQAPRVFRHSRVVESHSA